jgi:hypothetical protein
MRRYVSSSRPNTQSKLRRSSLNSTRVLRTDKLDDTLDKRSLKQSLANDVYELVNLLVECEGAKNRAFEFDTPMIDHYKQKTAGLKAKLVSERTRSQRLMRRHSVIAQQDLHGQLQAKVASLQHKVDHSGPDDNPSSTVMAIRVRELRRFNQELQQEIEYVKFSLADEGVDALLES